jgi:hypothetical protein
LSSLAFFDSTSKLFELKREIALGFRFLKIVAHFGANHSSIEEIVCPVGEVVFGLSRRSSFAKVELSEKMERRTKHFRRAYGWIKSGNGF